MRVAWTPVTLALAAILLVAATLRLYCLDCQGLWYDEVSSIEVAQRGIEAIITDRFGWMRVQTPLHYLLVWLTIQPLDPTASAVLVRLPSACAGLLTPLAVYGLGKEMFGRAQGLVAALMVALSAVHISHSQDARPYSFLALFTALSIYCLLVAERTGEGRWWLAFAGATVVNMFMTYHAATLALPAVAPYLLWTLYKTWRERGKRSDGEQVRAVVASLLIIALASVPVLLDIAGVPRIPPDISLFSLASVGDQLGRMLNRLGQVGLERDAETRLQWALAAVALAGAGVGMLRRQWRQHRAVLLCLSMLLIPAALMALLKTTNTVFQRYVLFTMPFYFLLIANALVTLWRLFPMKPLRAASRLAGGAVGAGILMLFGVGLFIYFNPEQHKRLSFLPDYRGAAQYLAEKAKPEDLIILADEPPQSMQVLGFYWRNTPPAPTFDAIDPRLYRNAGMRIFWVVNYQQNDPAYITELEKLYPQQAFTSVGQFDRLLVLEESKPGNVQAAVERMFARMSQVRPDIRASSQSLNTLQGSIRQARGDIAGAAALYRAAGPFYLMGNEYLTTAQGFYARGERAAAWREAIMSLFMEPYSPRIHSLLSQLLAGEKLSSKEQGVEQQVAVELSK